MPPVAIWLGAIVWCVLVFVCGTWWERSKGPIAPSYSLVIPQTELQHQEEKEACVVRSVELPGHADWLIKKRVNPTSTNPTLDELYRLIFNTPYSEQMDVIVNFQNLFNATAGIKFQWSNLNQDLDKIYDTIVMLHLNKNFPEDKGKWFFVEIGSFVGGSAIAQVAKLDSLGFPDIPFLCIDSWTGDVGLTHPSFDKFVQMDIPKISRPQYYSQFMMNVQSAIQENHIAHTHIVPLVMPSISGIRFLASSGIAPHYIYLDSAHYLAETALELEYAWQLLRPGGVMIGDDYGWQAVRHDVDVFVQSHAVEFGIVRNQWYMVKPPN